MRWEQIVGRQFRESMRPLSQDTKRFIDETCPIKPRSWFEQALLHHQLKCMGFDVAREFELYLAEHKKRRRMEIDIQIAALLKERDAL